MARHFLGRSGFDTLRPLLLVAPGGPALIFSPYGRFRLRLMHTKAPLVPPAPVILNKAFVITRMHCFYAIIRVIYSYQQELGRNVKNMLAVLFLLNGRWAHTIDKAKGFSIYYQ